MLDVMVLSEDYKGNRVMIRVQQANDFINAPADQEGRVHYIDHLQGIVEPLIARRGDIMNIKIEGQTP